MSTKSIMLRSLAYLCIVGSVAILTGCSSAGEIVETQKMSGIFDSQSKSIQIIMAENQDIKDDAYNRNQFANILATHIGKTKVFDQILTDGKASCSLKLTIKIMSIDTPNGALTVFASSAAKGEIRVQASFENSDTANRTLASLNVMGNSSHKMRTTVGGFGVDGAGSYTKAAMNQAAQRIAQYILEHSSKAKKS